MRIIGAGGVVPNTVIDEEMLEKLGLLASIDDKSRKLASSYGRRTSLPSAYILEGRNEVLEQTFTARTHSASDLGAAAIQYALARQELAPADIGLLIADTATQHQTCPSEASRVAERLEVRCPTYDLMGLAASMPLHLYALSSFKESSLPPLSVVVSADVPTQFVKYSSGPDASLAGGCWPFLASDGAGALLLAPDSPPQQHSKFGGFKVIRSVYRSPPASVERSRLSMQGYLAGGSDELLEWVGTETKGLLVEVARLESVVGKPVSLIAPPIGDIDLERCINQSGLDVAESFSQVSEVGMLWGSYPAFVLSKYWEQIDRSRPLIVITAGIGHTSGFLVLNWE